MPRVKISEFRAKKIVNAAMGVEYHGLPFDADHEHIGRFDDFIKENKSYVVKVDQGIKKRFKQGLIKLNVTNINEMVDAVAEIRKKGFSHFLIEEMIPHEQSTEKYIALELTDRGVVCHYSKYGGVDIESNAAEVKSVILSDPDVKNSIASELEINPDFIEKLVEVFEINYFSFLEINPLVVTFKIPYMLDIASEVDSAAEFFVDSWSAKDVRSARQNMTIEEKEIRKLSEKSSSSLSLTVLNPDGAIFMLLSGGGVSVALADEVANLGHGEILANYGEYSGNPTGEETYIYAKNILSLLLKSKAPKKVLIIGGGVANFTDVRITFKGVIRALDEVSGELAEQGIKVFVRRGGPHQKEGLESMEKFLGEKNLLGEVHGPELVVSEIVARAISAIKD